MSEQEDIYRLAWDLSETEPPPRAREIERDPVVRHWGFLEFFAGWERGRFFSRAAHRVCSFYVRRGNFQAAGRWRRRAGKLYERGL